MKIGMFGLKLPVFKPFFRAETRLSALMVGFEAF
jgi:hypothetical protein